MLLSVFFGMYLLKPNHVHAESKDSTVPSITYKGNPDVIETIKYDTHGNPFSVVAEIVKDDTPESHADIDKVEKDITKVEINITSLGNAQNNVVNYQGYTDAQKAIQENINTSLVSAYQDLKSCNSIGELNNNELDPVLTERARKINKDYLSYVYVVTDVFDITLVDKTEENKLYSESDRYCRITLSPSFDVTSVDEVLVIHRSNDGIWKVVPREDTTLLGNGDVTVYFDTLCPIAILKVSNTRVANLDDYINGITGRTCLCPSWCPFCDYLTVGNICFCFLIPVVIALLIILLAAIALYNNLTDLEKAKYRRPRAVIGPDIDIFADDEVVSSRKKKKQPRKPKLTSRILYPKLVPIPAFDIMNLPPEVYPKLEDNFITLFYNRSFTSRLTNANEFVKTSYQQLKDAILSHQVNNKVSWKYDAFRQGRKTIGRISIRGKMLYLYLQLDPTQFEGLDQFNHVYNVSDKKSHKITPTLVKINNRKGLRQALKLLNILFKEKEIKEIEYQQKDFISALKPMDDRSLLNVGLIKLRVKRTTEKIRYAKSIRIQEEATKESTLFFKDNDAINMLEYSSNIQKPKKPVVVYTDELSTYFENGEIVTLEELKHRIKKFPKRSTFLKIENRGSLNKRLIVSCDNIDIESTKMILLSGGRVYKSQKSQ